jgi:acyl-CoA thioesterase-1
MREPMVRFLTLAGMLLLATVLLPLHGWTQEASASKSTSPIKLVALGDSLTAGLGLAEADTFPVRLAAALKQQGFAVDIGNAGVSGDTSSGGLDRLDWSIPDGTDAVIVELGANDALRGLDPTMTRQALGDILAKLKARGISVFLCGMYAPPNLGADYAKSFDAIYPELAKKYDVPLYPFFLDGVAGDAVLNQADGMHPTPAGVNIIVTRILPSVEAWLRPIQAERSLRE